MVVLPQPEEQTGRLLKTRLRGFEVPPESSRLKCLLFEAGYQFGAHVNLL